MRNQKSPKGKTGFPHGTFVELWELIRSFITWDLTLTESGPELPASQASFIWTFFPGARGAQAIISTSAFYISVALHRFMASAARNFLQTLAPPAVEEQLCKPLEPAVSIGVLIRFSQESGI